MRLELTRRTDLAARALAVLAAADRRLKAGEVAEALGTTTGFVPQVLAPLIRRSWVDSAPGPTGGYALTAELRDLAVPTEHGGWSLTAEPAVLGLLVAPGAAGVAIAAAALVAFVARTPLTVLLVDRRRDRQLERDALARRVATGEVLALALLAGFAV